MPAFADVAAAALTLSRAERAELARKLLESLDDESFDDPEVVEAEWNAEILRRVEDIKSGKVVPIPYEEVRRQFER